MGLRTRVAGPAVSSRSIGTVKAAATTALVDRWWAFVDAERASLALWLPVAFSAGVALWFVLPWEHQRLALALVLGGCGAAGLVSGWRPLAAAGLLALAGMGVAEWRSMRVAAPILPGRTVVSFAATIEAVEDRASRGQYRLLLAPDAAAALPPRVRLAVRGPAPAAMAPGARLSMRAMLSPPNGAAVPGGHDFARAAWFAGIGATGFPLGRIAIIAPAPPPANGIIWLDAVRAALTRRIIAAVPGDPGAIAAAFITGDQGRISLETAQAMRDSGLAHLLSISGLHIAVVVGGTMLLVRRSLCLVPAIALRWPVKGIAVAAAALVGIAYTFLAGAQVPTVRTILATVIVLFGIGIGREAFSLRLLAAAAFIILAARPEALVGPSFQLSFAAVIAIVALYESPLGRALTTPPEDEGRVRWAGRHFASLLVSGMVAELALSSIGLFHFNRAGVYGVVANLVAIPFSSFIVMPLLVLALVADGLGLGVWVWPAVGWAMGWLIHLATTIASLPGAILRLPMMPAPAYALIVAGGLWLCLWRTRVRFWGAGVLVAGLAMTLLSTPPDLLISADGHNAALRLQDGRLALLRPRTGPFLRSVWGDALATNSEVDLVDLRGTNCSKDTCVAVVAAAGGRRWRLLATVSRQHVARDRFEAACADADLVISDRRLPRWCAPRWRVFDRRRLGETGAVAIWLGSGRVVSVGDAAGDHPWHPRPPVFQPRANIVQAASIDVATPAPTRQP